MLPRSLHALHVPCFSESQPSIGVPERSRKLRFRPECDREAEFSFPANLQDGRSTAELDAGLPLLGAEVRAAVGAARAGVHAAGARLAAQALAAALVRVRRPAVSRVRACIGAGAASVAAGPIGRCAE